MRKINIEQKTTPFLKWAGGKTQLLAELRELVPKEFNKYIEPMVGGGALFFSLKPSKAVLGDSNEELIDCYRVVRDSVEDLIRELKKFRNSERYFYRIRSQNPNELAPIKKAARFIYLNKTCYNGLYRVNKEGKFNVPFGRRKNPTICDEENLRAAHAALQGVELEAGDYKEILRKHAKKGDFIYLDPPYYPLGGYADFKRYTKEFFYEEDHIELRDEFCRLANIGCYVVLTNSNTEYVRDLYKGFEYTAVDTKRNISSKSSTRTGQDLILASIRLARNPSHSLMPLTGRLLERFPGTRLMGSKYKLLPFIWNCVEDLSFKSVLDAFSGSACVSYMFKQYGKRVISNDFMHFAYHFARALIENKDRRIQDNEVRKLIRPNSRAKTFIFDTFGGLYFSDDENKFLDSLVKNIEELNDPYKVSLALASITRACLKRRPRGLFTYTGERYYDGRRDMQIDLKQHFIENIKIYNNAVFDNGEDNIAFNKDVFDLEGSADLVYLDPPYYTPRSDNDYTRRYHFIEGLVRQWIGLEIQENTITKKFARYRTPFMKKDAARDAFLRLFDKYKASIIVVSYSSNSIPEKAELFYMLKQYKKKVRVHQKKYTYSFGTHAHKKGNLINRAEEYIFVGY